MILNELEKEGQNIRRAYQRRLPSDQSKDYYFMQRNTGNTESVTIEYGFLDSNGDDINQLKSNWEKYAEAVVRAITKYKNIEYRESNSDFKEIYKVMPGDRLYNIAKKYNITIKDIMNLNKLTTNLLNIGQKILIPYDIQQEYVVKKGDTLYSIANQFSTTIDNLLNINNLQTNILSIGQILKVI